jgi:DNA-directed RNA polymerase III subunit RPC1
MRESVLTNASFEQTMDHLLDAAVHSRDDALVGVSECIITGMPIPMGTGLIKIIHRPLSHGCNSNSNNHIKIFKKTRLLETL